MQGIVRCGTSGWSHSDWNAVIYPPVKPRGFHPLEHLAQYLDLIEIDASFHQPLRPELSIVAPWVESLKKDADVDLSEADELPALGESSDPPGRAAPPGDKALEEKHRRIPGTPRLRHDRHQGLENRAESGFPGHVRHERLNGEGVARGGVPRCAHISVHARKLRSRASIAAQT